MSDLQSLVFIIEMLCCQNAFLHRQGKEARKVDSVFIQYHHEFESVALLLQSIQVHDGPVVVLLYADSLKT